MNSYRVKVPREIRLAGHIANGQRATVLPREHHVHRLSKVSLPVRALGRLAVGSRRP
jgi:hypothetical protein